MYTYFLQTPIFDLVIWGNMRVLLHESLCNQQLIKVKVQAITVR